MITHKRNALIALSSGEYSDYRFNGLYKVTKDMDFLEVAKAYVDQAPMCDWDDERKDLSEEAFAAYLLRHGWVIEIDYHEIHLGNYGNFEPNLRYNDRHLG